MKEPEITIPCMFDLLADCSTVCPNRPECEKQYGEWATARIEEGLDPNQEL